MPWSFCREVLCTLDKMPAFLEVYVDGVSYYQTDKGDFFPKDALPQKFVDTLMGQMTGVESLKQALDKKDIEKLTVYFDDRQD